MQIRFNWGYLWATNFAPLKWQKREVEHKLQGKNLHKQSEANVISLLSFQAFFRRSVCSGRCELGMVAGSVSNVIQGRILLWTRTTFSDIETRRHFLLVSQEIGHADVCLMHFWSGKVLEKAINSRHAQRENLHARKWPLQPFVSSESSPAEMQISAT